MARNSIFFSFVFLLLLSSISPSLEDDVMRFVRNHLKSFGYLSGDHHTSVDDTYDEALVSALRKYQNFYGLNVSGRLEPETLTMMSRPRCGLPDRHSTDNVHNITLQYAFLPGNPKWPKSKKKLKYQIITRTPLPITTVRMVLSSAFSKWSVVSRFTFNEAKSILSTTHIHVGFFKGSHGDGHPFDGRGGSLAHASPPTKGDLHFDGDEEWGTNPDKDHVDLESVALHEMGHLLGLAHSNVESAVMFPLFDYGEIKRDLQQDDINGIHALYDDD